MNIDIQFVNERQEEFYSLTQRNECFSGGYGNGKSFILCLKELTLLSTFPYYRTAFIRKVYKDLRRTTMSTFYSVCPPELYAEKFGGRRADNDGYCRLINGAEIFFIGLDNFDEKSLKSFEINSAAIDQGEELDENIYIHLDSRVGRWSKAEIPEHLKHLPFRVNKFTGKQVPPAYTLIGCNPDSRLHWLFRRYHPESIEWQEKYKRNHVMINCPSTENPALDPELLQEMLDRDPEWVRRFVYGEWGISDATIHVILPDSIISPSADWLQNFKNKAKLYRVMDHGESSPTVCLWFAVHNNMHVCYREYYQPDRLISYHRKMIEEMSGDEIYTGNYADPSIFHKNSQKNGGKWSVADEYLDRLLCSAKTIAWQAADNHEMPIRNRINELLRHHPSAVHPIKGNAQSPLLYFVKKSPENPQGCYFVIKETEAQRREMLGHDNGKPIYSDDREKSISDHAYDCLRYYCTIKSAHINRVQHRIPVGSFLDVRNQLIKQHFGSGPFQHGMPVPA